MTKQINTRETASLETPSYLEQYAGVGNENVTREDMVVPRLGLVQALSPQKTKSDAEYIPGIEEGDIFHSVSREVYKQGVYVVNCHFVKSYAIFKDRLKGGGFRGAFPTLEEAEAMRQAQPDAADLAVQEQAVHYLLVLDEDKDYVSEAALICAVTKMKFSKKWNNLIAFGNPMGCRFQKIWKLTSLTEKNQKGTWYNWTASPAGFVTEDLAAMANTLHDAVAKGLKSVEQEQGSVVSDDDINY